VFGGNFLHAFNIPMQLQCYQLEERTRTEGKFRFPLFEMMQWYAAQTYLKKLQGTVFPYDRSIRPLVALWCALFRVTQR
jgi:hypothetical protein